MFQVNTEFQLNQLKFLFTQDISNLSFISQMLSIRSFQKHTVFTAVLLLFTVDKVCNIRKKKKKKKEILIN